MMYWAQRNISVSQGLGYIADFFTSLAFLQWYLFKGIIIIIMIPSKRY